MSDAKPMMAEEIEKFRNAVEYHARTPYMPLPALWDSFVRQSARLLATVDALQAENAAMREALEKIIKAGEYPAPCGMVRIAREALEPQP